MNPRPHPGIRALLLLLLLGASARGGDPPADPRPPGHGLIITTSAQTTPGRMGTEADRDAGNGLEPPNCVLTPVDLPAALRLAGIQDPIILIARQRVEIAVAFAQLAAAQLLPSTNLGMNYEAHGGPLQQSSGNILRVDRSALYVGAGANAVAAGTVNIPGLVYQLNLSQTIFDMLIARLEVDRREFAAVAVQNEMFRQVAVAYTDLLRTVGRRSIAQQTYDEAAEVARVTLAFVERKQAAAADGDRTVNEREMRRTDLIEARAEVLIASARLAALLGLDQCLLLQPIETSVVPLAIVPESIPLCQLLAIALLQRPELAEWSVAIRQALLALYEAKVLPFSPNLIVGFSGGSFGGGSSIVGQAGQPIFGNVGLRNDLDAISYWTLQNMGIGNLALIRAAKARVGIQELQKLVIFNLVRRQVAEAATRVHARFQQIGRAEQSMRRGTDAFKEDFARVGGLKGRPIELLESLRLLAQARYLYLNAIVDYNVAQIDLYVALGRPPADVLARPVPTNFTAPIPEAPRKGAGQ